MSSFQGKNVTVEQISLTGSAREVTGLHQLPEMDEIVEARIEGRVTGYKYSVDEKTGNLTATAIIKVLEVEDVTTLSIPNMTMVAGGQP